MFLQEIEIQNFRGIKKINIDFSSNKNGIEKEVKIGRFKLVDGNVPIPSVSALVGRNSVGKTTIISAISFCSDIYIGIIGQQIVNKLIEEEVANNIPKNISIGDIKGWQNIQNERIEKRDKIVNSIQLKKGIYMQKYSTMFQEWLMKYYEENSNTSSKEIFIKMSFCQKQNKFGYLLFSLNEEGEIKITEKGDFKNKDFINFFKSSLLPKRDYKFNHKNILLQNQELFNETSGYFDLKNDDINMALINLIRNLKIDLIEKIIRLSDEEVDKIKYTVARQNKNLITIGGIILKNGSIINTRDLSSGTKKFIIIVEAIVRSIMLSKETNSGLIIIDEIETNLHKELVQSLLLLLRFSFHNKNIQSIITTHNIHFIEPEISTRQIFSITKENDKHTVKRLSSFMKSHESLVKKYNSGMIAPYPDKELARNTIADIFDEI